MLLQKYCSSILLFMLLLQTLLWIKLLLLLLLSAVYPTAAAPLPQPADARAAAKSHVAHYIESVLRAG